MSAKPQTTTQKVNPPAQGTLGAGEEAIVVDNLSKSYGSRRVVDQLTITVHRGEVFALLGPNGAGNCPGRQPYTCLSGRANSWYGSPSAFGYVGDYTRPQATRRDGIANYSPDGRS